RRVLGALRARGAALPALLGVRYLAPSAAAALRALRLGRVPLGALERPRPRLLLDRDSPVDDSRLSDAVRHARRRARGRRAHGRGPGRGRARGAPAGSPRRGRLRAGQRGVGVARLPSPPGVARRADMKGLSGRAALVTVGGGGIGRAIAERLGAEGAGVGVGDIGGAKAAAEAIGRGSYGFALDVTDSASVRAGVGEVIAHFGRVDVLVNNAG